MKKNFTIIMVTLLFSIFSSSQGEARSLRLKPVKEKDIAGTFTLILYGANHSNDLETIAILDNEGDEYEFEPYAPKFSYKTKKALSAKAALSEAEKFVSWHRSFRSLDLSRILDPKGNTVGYEVRPLYYPIDLGFSDVLDVDYAMKGKKIIVRIRLLDSVERRLRGDDERLFER